MSECLSTFELESEDILAQRRTGSDLRWAAREWEEIVSYKYQKKLNKTDIFQQILKSDRVAHTMNQLVIDGQSRKNMEKEIMSILEDMCHTLDIGMIRKFAFVLPKIMKRIYGRVLVNPAGIEIIRKVSAEAPVIFLPTHRSYADFLLISYIAYHYNLPVPVIAAGMDFLSMAVIGDMLRGAGAFYIRRSFVDDSLYWAVFQEYVQCLLCDFGQPIEFFLEGTRSRSGKSLPPKLGLLGCVVECWLRGRIPDIIIIPISMSYNRTLEEKLYAYEMLGVPKPKESTSGLLKAMKILKESFGDIYVNFGDSLSISKLLGPSVSRHLTVGPSHFSTLSSQEFNACEALGLLVCRRLQENCVVSIWSMACVSLLRCLWGGLWSLPLRLLLQETLIVARWAQRLGAVVEGGGSMESVEYHLRRGLKEHCETALLKTDDIVHIQVIHKDNQGLQDSKPKGFSLSASTVECSVTHLLLQYYVNQVLHLFIRPMLLAMVIRAFKKPLTRGQLFDKFDLLRSIFSFDFIFERHLSKKDFDDSLVFMEDEGCVEAKGDAYFAVWRDKPSSCPNGKMYLLDLLTDLIRPFQLNYQVALQVAVSQPAFESESSLVCAIQAAAETSAATHLLYSTLSLDTCQQAVKMLIKMGALSKSKSLNGKMELVSNSQVISALKESLQPSLFVPKNIKSKL